jgi:ABC-type multidrug transport system fused ATPase/permease subunit
MARVVQAARQACVHEAITGLPQSYLTVLAEKGTRLSSGERQRIAIARALYRNSPIMILDEVTSALDARAEEAVRNTLKKLQGEKTILVAAHRLSTITHADRILVLANGLIVEEGRHDTLLANRGRYWDFWRRHLGREPAPA